jgi:hypothetical protein
MKRVEITRPVMGFAHMQVCAVADATDAEILAACNQENPSGTTNGWTRVCREDRPEEKLRPVPCASDPERRHFLVVC